MRKPMDIEGQSFIVTGAAKGIGLAISTLFHQLGARVSGWDLDDSGMRDNPVFTDTQIVDVSDEGQTRAGFAASLAALGDIDGIVANAGINGPTKPLWDYSLDEWQSVISVDLTGVFLSVQASLHHLRARKRGRIIIISSVAGKEGNPGAVHSLTLVVAQDLYQSRLEGDEPEPLEVVKYPLADIETLAMQSDFHEGRAIAALFLVKQWLAEQ